MQSIWIQKVQTVGKKVQRCEKIWKSILHLIWYTSLILMRRCWPFIQHFISGVFLLFFDGMGSPCHRFLCPLKHWSSPPSGQYKTPTSHPGNSIPLHIFTYSYTVGTIASPCHHCRPTLEGNLNFQHTNPVNEKPAVPRPVPACPGLC